MRVGSAQSCKFWSDWITVMTHTLASCSDPYHRKPYQPAEPTKLLAISSRSIRNGRPRIVKDIGFRVSLGQRPSAQGILVSSYKVRRDENAPILGDNGCPFGAGGIAVTSPAHGPVGCPWWSDAGRQDCGPPRNSRTWAAHALRRHSHRRHAGDRHIQMNGWPS